MVSGFGWQTNVGKAQEFVIWKSCCSTWEGLGGIWPPESKRGAQIQNVSSHEAFKRPFKMCIATGGLFAVLWRKESFKFPLDTFLFLIVLYLAFLYRLLKYNSRFKKKKQNNKPYPKEEHNFSWKNRVEIQLWFKKQIKKK